MFSRIFLLAACLSLSFVSYAQSGYISDDAFRKMMQDHFRFTIVGSQTPVSGLKVETANPSITLKGNIVSNQSRSRILNLELQGGLSDGFMQLFSGKKLNGYFKGTLGINFLSRGNKGYYNRLSTIERQMTAHAIKNNLKALTMQMDTFAVIKVLTDNSKIHDQAGFKLSNFVDAVYNQTINSYQLDSLNRDDVRSILQWRTYFEELISVMLVKYGADSILKGEARFNDFRTKVSDPNETTVKTKSILQDYDRLYDLLVKEPNTYHDRQHDFEIALTKFNWNLMRISWFNVSAVGTNARFWLYNTDKQNVLDTNSFTRGLSASYNIFFKYKEPHRYIYVRAGVMVQRVNNLADLKKFSYKEETVITTNPGVLTDKKEGTAYRGMLSQKNGYDLFAEVYYAKWESASFPGVYIKPMLRHSSAWINPTQLSADLGIVWNVGSSDKESKNLLTIVPYVSWSNILPAYKDDTKKELQPASERFSFNVRFGLPFNLGK